MGLTRAQIQTSTRIFVSGRTTHPLKSKSLDMVVSATSQLLSATMLMDARCIVSLTFRQNRRLMALSPVATLGLLQQCSQASPSQSISRTLEFARISMPTEDLMGSRAVIY